MVVWSSFRALGRIRNKQEFIVSLLKRGMSGGHGNTMQIDVSRWQWHKFKDMFHYYFMIGLIPSVAISFYTNVFIGPAKLAEIPEGYTPKPWEYQKHPITRFIVQYFQTSYQQEYEKYMHYLYEQDEKAKIRKLTKMVTEKMKDRNDYQAYFYRPVTAKYFRESKAIREETKLQMGENY